MGNKNDTDAFNADSGTLKVKGKEIKINTPLDAMQAGMSDLSAVAQNRHSRTGTQHLFYF